MKYASLTAHLPAVQIGLRVKLARGCVETMGRPDRLLPYMPWLGGLIPVGAVGTLALATKSPNELFSERVRQYRQPDRICVIWDKEGPKAVPYTQPGTGRDMEGVVYQFCINARVGDPLPDYLEIADVDDHVRQSSVDDVTCAVPGSGGVAAVAGGDHVDP